MKKLLATLLVLAMFADSQAAFWGSKADADVDAAPVMREKRAKRADKMGRKRAYSEDAAEVVVYEEDAAPRRRRMMRDHHHDGACGNCGCEVKGCRSCERGDCHNDCRSCVKPRRECKSCPKKECRSCDKPCRTC